MTEVLIKERPILFSGAMVQALLNGSKTQTRRAVKNQPEGDGVEIMHGATKFPAYGLSDWISDKYQGYGFQTDDELWRCPYGQPGERLWVRECFASGKKMGEDGYLTDEPLTIYRATDEDVQWYDGADDCPVKTPWKPSIHMPRVASRLLLEITAVRVERLQDISEADAKAEGIESRDGEGFYWRDYELKNGWHANHPVMSYETLWRSINGPDSWDANPWVWVVEFKVIEPTNG